MKTKIIKFVPLMFCFGTIVACNGNPKAPDPKDPELVSIKVTSAPSYFTSVDLLKDDIEVRAYFNDGTDLRVYDWTCNKNFFDENGRHQFTTKESTALKINYKNCECTLDIDNIKDEFDYKVTEVQWKRILAELIVDSYSFNIYDTSVLKTTTINKYVGEDDVRSEITSSDGQVYYEQFINDYYWTINNDLITFNGQNSKVFSYLKPIYDYFYEYYKNYKFIDSSKMYEIEDYDLAIQFISDSSRDIKVNVLHTFDNLIYTFKYTPVDPSSWPDISSNLIETKFSKNEEGKNSFTATFNAEADKQYFFFVNGSNENQDEFNKDKDNLITVTQNGSYLPEFNNCKIYLDGSTTKLEEGKNKDYVLTSEGPSFTEDTYKSKNYLIIEYTNASALSDVSFDFSYNIPKE